MSFYRPNVYSSKHADINGKVLCGSVEAGGNFNVISLYKSLLVLPQVLKIFFFVLSFTFSSYSLPDDYVGQSTANIREVQIFWSH